VKVWCRVSDSVSKKWKDQVLAKMATFLATGEHFEETSDYNPATQWMICRMVAKGIPFRLIQMGAGVKHITTHTDICPKCHGMGRC